ncbi:STM3941 family protein [Flavihumibacter sp. ZG627]|uniref:STM3941 family protein n=1 Tax=Flavihumibacter sp. ZG627 TaxID=1463156 RepID=UPI00057EF79F|nr:STM3941 family protein [Flavihumibacter sp. ZG627]KIC89406.1 hypothetical protein HY58_16170 [Flavihumibacter sp. ZG627]
MEPSEEIIEIELSKKKILLMLVGSLAFVAIGIWFVISPPAISNSYWGNPTKLAFVGYASIFFFGLCAFLLFRKLSDKKPGLIIDNTGITDNSGGVSAGQILWSDLEDISVMEMHRQKLIMLHVKNPQEYIDKQTSGFKRKMMQMNYNMYGTPLSITTNGLKISFDDLMATLIAKVKSHGQ